MKGMICRLGFFLCLVIHGNAEENYCLSFPLEIGREWHYQSESWPYSMTSVILDTTSIHGDLYFKYELYGNDNPSSHYWMRPYSNSIRVLNPVDSTEYLLFYFGFEGESSWEIPLVIVPPLTQPVNQCDWGANIAQTMSWETIYGPNRTYYFTFGFTHSNHPCMDAGISTTFFSRDIGLVHFSQITEGDVIDWTLVTPSLDTLAFSGSYLSVGNPCLTDPCLPGIVGALETDSLRYILTLQDRFIQDGLLEWNQAFVLPGDSIRVTGFTTQRQDIRGDPYITLEILELDVLAPDAIDSGSRFLAPEKPVLFQNYPNPFNPETTLLFSIPVQGSITLTIYNLRSEIIKRVNEQNYPAGKHEFHWDGTGLQGKPVSGGVYFARLESGERSDVIKLMLLK